MKSRIFTREEQKELGIDCYSAFYSKVKGRASARLQRTYPEIFKLFIIEEIRIAKKEIEEELSNG